jgi:hypothetical protein
MNQGFIFQVNIAISEMEEQLETAEDENEKDVIRATIAAYRWCIQIYYDSSSFVIREEKELGDDSILNIGKIRRQILKGLVTAQQVGNEDLVSNYRTSLKVMDLILGE